MTKRILSEAEKEAQYDALKDGTLYRKEDDDTIAILEEIDGGEDEPTPAVIVEIMEEIEAYFDKKHHTLDDLPFGQLRDGTPITSVYDEGEPNGHCGIVHATVGDWFLTAQDEPSLLSIQGNLTLEDVTLDDINALRAFLATDIPEQLLASAAANGQGLDALVPAKSMYAEWLEGYECEVEDCTADLQKIIAERKLAAALAVVKTPPITVECLYKPADGGDLTTDAEAGALAYVKYVCGEGKTQALVSHSIRHNDAVLELPEPVTLAEADELVRNLQNILADPRVQALNG